jgi:hypothetical protein
VNYWVTNTQARGKLDDLLGTRSIRPDWDVSDGRVTLQEWRLLEGVYGPSLREGDDGVLRQAVEALYALRKAGTTIAPVHVDTADRRRAPKNRQLAHHDALAALLAKYAAADPIVVAFRHKVVGRKLIEPHAVDAWLRARAVAKNKKGRPRKPFRLLAYGTPGCDTALHLAVAADGALAPLVELSDRLARTYGWHPAEATVFVLTGYVPPARSIRVDFYEDMRLRARSRVTLTIDPTSTPNEVAAAYRRRRNQVFGRTRRLTPTLAKLAQFTIEHDGIGWRDRMQEWNASSLRSKYNEVAAFRRDSEQALTRLRDLRLPRRPQKD